MEEKKQLVENKRKDKKAKKLAQKEKQDNQSFFQVSKSLIRLGHNLIYKFNPLITLKNAKNPDFLT